jgi:hypothetical protein
LSSLVGIRVFGLRVGYERDILHVCTDARERHHANFAASFTSTSSTRSSRIALQSPFCATARSSSRSTARSTKPTSTARSTKPTSTASEPASSTIPTSASHCLSRTEQREMDFRNTNEQLSS